MKGYLNQQQIAYVLFHIEQSLVLTDDIKGLFQFLKHGDSIGNKKSIFFKLSSEELEILDVRYIDELPILFSTENYSTFFSIKNNQLFFHHDLLKSCFYLLSGYQEFGNTDPDSFGRYKHSNSIQNTLGFTKKPLVNYYFKIIEEGLMEFCSQQKIVFKKKHLFSSPVFFLTHDIDNVDFFTINRFLYKIKELMGLVKSQYGFATNVKHFFQSGFELLKFGAKKNPNWNFKYLIDLEQKNNIKSSFYFLPRDKKHQDSNYSFNEQRIQDLFRFIIEEKCEVGIHGTVNSVENLNILENIVADLKTNAPLEKIGIRQHRLLYKLPITAINHAKAHISYDTTLCFAEHEGFRNSYCLPFKLYDFENDKPVDVWQIPLNVMDVTLFHYRGLDNAKALTSIKDLMLEVEKFNGVFTLLWHNDFFDEDRYPGTTELYENLLKYMGSTSFKSLTGLEIVAHVE